MPWLLAAMAIVMAGVAAVAIPWSRRNGEALDEDAVVYKVEPILFEHSVVEPGEIESSRNLEIRCEIQSRNSSGTMILEIVPAGTIVKPGDVLIKFDGSALESERTAQQSITSSSEALVIQSENTYETAVIARKEYLEGTFAQEEQLIESEVFVAEENMRRAEEYARYSERLAARGFVTAQQLEADKFAVDKAQKDLEAAKTKLKVLREFTKQKMLKTLDAAIATAAAKLKADQRTYQLDQDKLALIEAQLKACVVKAPSAGKVVYANETDRRGNQEVIIQEGAIIRERQAVIRLPDMTEMQVKAKINESRIGFVSVGMPATITLDAFPDLRLEGKVTQVDEFPLPPGWSSGNIKQYATYVAMTDPPANIRPGLTANVEIHVDQIPNAIAVPVHALHEHKGQYYCLVKNGEDVEARWVEVGASNDKQVVIKTGLTANEQVVENPDVFVELVSFPAPPPDKAGKPKVLLAKANDNPGVDADDKSKAGRGAGESGGKGSRGEGGRSGRGGRGGFDPAAMFDRYDTNKDGTISIDEIPAERRDRLVSADANKDGKIDRAELSSSMSRQRGGGGGGPNVPAGNFGGGGQ
jgi:multidrug efflux pump subunit AcrA (membrane-fusion protein)